MERRLLDGTHVKPAGDRSLCSPRSGNYHWDLPLGLFFILTDQFTDRAYCNADCHIRIVDDRIFKPQLLTLLVRYYQEHRTSSHRLQ